jgi:hypothetical protein
LKHHQKDYSFESRTILTKQYEEVAEMLNINRGVIYWPRKYDDCIQNGSLDTMYIRAEGHSDLDL